MSASLAGEVFMMSRGLAECEWISGVLAKAVHHTTNPRCTDENQSHCPQNPLWASRRRTAICRLSVIDDRSVFDHLVREPTGSHYRRTAQELSVIRSMQTLRARCRWVPHERMVITMLNLFYGPWANSHCCSSCFWPRWQCWERMR